MAVLMIEHIDGMDEKQYEEFRRLAKWDSDRPKGFLFHVASFADGNAHIADIWETAEDFQNFVRDRIMPAAQQLGLSIQPDVQIYPTHAILNPGNL
jgi:hypothetical protein